MYRFFVFSTQYFSPFRFFFVFSKKKAKTTTTEWINYVLRSGKIAHDPISEKIYLLSYYCFSCFFPLLQKISKMKMAIRATTNQGGKILVHVVQ